MSGLSGHFLAHTLFISLTNILAVSLGILPPAGLLQAQEPPTNPETKTPRGRRPGQHHLVSMLPWRSPTPHWLAPIGNWSLTILYHLVIRVPFQGLFSKHPVLNLPK